jgi:hypothetical protein
MINYGDKKRVITISVFGEDHTKIRYSAYPPALDYIIEAIRKMTHRLEG